MCIYIWVCVCVCLFPARRYRCCTIRQCGYNYEMLKAGIETSVGHFTPEPSSFSASVKKFFTYICRHVRYWQTGVLDHGKELLYFSAYDRR